MRSAPEGTATAGGYDGFPVRDFPKACCRVSPQRLLVLFEVWSVLMFATVSISS